MMDVPRTRSRSTVLCDVLGDRSNDGIPHSRSLCSVSAQGRYAKLSIATQTRSSNRGIPRPRAAVCAGVNHCGMPRGFLPWGFSNTCPQVGSMPTSVTCDGQVSDNPKQERSSSSDRYEATCRYRNVRHYLSARPNVAASACRESRAPQPCGFHLTEQSIDQRMV